MECEVCGKPATHRCEYTGAQLCWEHARLAVVAAHRSSRKESVTVLTAGPEQRAHVVKILLDFWGKTDNMLTFGKTWDLLAERSVLGYVGNELAGIITWAPHEGRGLVLDLSIYPQYQGMGVGGKLLLKAEVDMQAAGLETYALSTTNDNLPALYFYQRRGWVIEAILPGIMAEHHKKSGEPYEAGFGSIPVRDEIRLVKHWPPK